MPLGTLNDLAAAAAKKKKPATEPRPSAGSDIAAAPSRLPNWSPAVVLVGGAALVAALLAYRWWRSK
jgi:hypothetical protein